MDSTSELGRIMRTVPVFRELEGTELDELTRLLTERLTTAGQIVIREGDSAKEFFVVLAGEFQVFVRQESLDFEKQLRQLGGGSYFGEIGIFAGDRRTASVRALTDGRVAVLDQSSLRKLMERSPSASMALCRGMAMYARGRISLDTAIPFIDLDGLVIDPSLTALIPPRVSLYTKSIAVAKDGDTLRVAMVDPYDAAPRSFLSEVLRAYRIEWAAVSQGDFDRYAADKIHDQIDSAGVADTDLSEMSYVTGAGQTVDLGERDTAVLLEKVFRKALKFGASDVHFEPGGEFSRVRMRIDGKMVAVEEAIAPRLFAQVVSRLKVMSELDITNRRLPQDGRFLLHAGPHRLQTRVSVMPCKGGEKIVLRTLNSTRPVSRLNQLILSPPVAMLAREMFLSPNGLVLVCGPTGSGKTTTLYAGLTELWCESATYNIVTIEDPVEYPLEFATQIQVNRAVGLEFPAILRSVLRQDADVILVGEMRDEESAGIAVEAAMTGRLVLSSLHTDSAIDTILRLRNLNVKPFLAAAALRCVVAQQLAPKLCEKCARPAPLSDATRARLLRVGIIDEGWSGTPCAGPGCDSCLGAGTRGRVGVYELLVVDAGLRNLIESGASLQDLHGSLTRDNFVPMARYARFLLERNLVGADDISRLFAPR